MADFKSELLKKAKFGRFQQENREALDILDKEKRALRTKRKLRQANERAGQVKVKFKNVPAWEGGTPSLREAMIKVGNQVHPVRATFSYGVKSDTIVGEDGKPLGHPSKRIRVHGIYSSNRQRKNDPVNSTFKPSQLKQVLDVVKKKFPEANRVVGERVTGIRKNSPFTMQRIPLKGLANKMKGKKLGIAGLGFTLGEAIRAGMDAYKANKDKL